MYFDVKKANYLGEYRVRLWFEDGSEGIADLSDFPNEGNVFAPFLDAAYFREFRVECGALIWGNGELDIAPEELYARATGKPIRYDEEVGSRQG